MKITLGSLFDGIGGFPLAASRYGIKTLWASEIEPFPIKVTKTRFPDMKHLGDITQIHGAKIEPVDIITFGSPCQDLSVAGKRAGLAGKRSGLFMEAVRIIKEMRNTYDGAIEPIRPRFAVWENVPGAFSSNKGEDFRAVLEEICRVKDETVIIPEPPKGKWNTVGAIMGNGYSVAWRVLDAQYWGVPQRRRRIFLVADFGGQSAPEILFKRQGLSRYIEESGEEGEEITASIGEGVENAITFRDVAGTLRANAGAPKHEADWEQLICHSIGFNGDQSEKTRSMEEAEEQCPTLRAGGSTHVAISYGIQGSMIGRADKNGPQGSGINEDVSFTLNTTDRHAVATKVYSIGGYNSEGMKSGNPHSGIYEAETSRTIDQNGGSPACNQGGMEIVQTTETVLFEPRSQDGVPRIHKDIVPTLNTAQGGQRQPCIAQTYQSVVLNDQGGSQMSVSNDVVGTLRAEMHGNIPAVATYQETVGSLCAKDYKGIGNQYISEDKGVIAPKYSVRRLTPLECERLQGFPDGWTDIPGQTEATEEELEFWREVWFTWDKTQAEDPEKVKPRTDKRLLRWLKNPTSDSAQYKALGNSVAVPCPEYVIEGIREALDEEEEF